MLKTEFEKLTGVKVTAGEYDRIEHDYMESSLSKEEFCKKWKRQHRKALDEQRVEKIQSIERLKQYLYAMKISYESLAGAAHGQLNFFYAGKAEVVQRVLEDLAEAGF